MGLFLDTAFPPSAAACVKMCRDHNAQGWAGYLGGPYATNAWPANIAWYIVREGFGVLPIYVGQQKGGRLTRAQGLIDGRAAVALMGRWPGPKVCLDVETATYVSDRIGTLDYWSGWRAAVLTAGLVPGIYAHLSQIDAFDGAAFRWGASYIRRSLLPLPSYDEGAREWAWQYADSFELDGVDVDASVGTIVLNGFSEPDPPPETTDTGGRMFITYDIGQDAMAEVYADCYGECRWGVWIGGAGQFEGWTGDLSTLGSPLDAKDLVECTGAFTTHDSVLRLNIRGVRADGSRWVKVMDAHSAAVIEEWTQTGSTPNQRADVLVGVTPDQVIAEVVKRLQASS